MKTLILGKIWYNIKDRSQTLLGESDEKKNIAKTFRAPFKL